MQPEHAERTASVRYSRYTLDEAPVAVTRYRDCLRIHVLGVRVELSRDSAFQLATDLADALDEHQVAA